MRTTWMSSIAVLATLAATATPALAADTLVAPGVQADRLTALAGTVVWVDGDTIMRRSPAGAIAPVKGAPAGSYPSIDLGRTRSGKLVLTYLRCSSAGTGCNAISDDLAGHRVRYRRLAPPRCRLSAAPSRWRDRVAYGLLCSKLKGAAGVPDPKRSGLFIREGAGAARELALWKGPAPTDVHPVSAVDLRGSNVGAVYAEDTYASYAVAQTVTGTGLRFDGIVSNCPGACDGVEHPTFERFGSLALGSGGALWSLVTVDGEGARTAKISRLVAGGCRESESLAGPAAMAVDGATTYLAVPGVGIVAHDFAPTVAACP